MEREREIRDEERRRLRELERERRLQREEAERVAKERERLKYYTLLPEPDRASDSPACCVGPGRYRIGPLHLLGEWCRRCLDWVLVSVPSDLFGYVSYLLLFTFFML